jgi:hypothetical protein
MEKETLLKDIKEDLHHLPLFIPISHFWLAWILFTCGANQKTLLEFFKTASMIDILKELINYIFLWPVLLGTKLFN